MPDQPPYRSPVLEHLGLVAGRYDALSIGDVRDHATPRPEMRDRTGGAAVQALGLKGLGGINHALSLGPRCLQNKPTSRRIAPRGAPAQLHADARSRALDTLSASGVTERIQSQGPIGVPLSMYSYNQRGTRDGILS